MEIGFYIAAYHQLKEKNLYRRKKLCEYSINIHDKTEDYNKEK